MTLITANYVLLPGFALVFQFFKLWKTVEAEQDTLQVNCKVCSGLAGNLCLWRPWLANHKEHYSPPLRVSDLDMSIFPSFSTRCNLKQCLQNKVLEGDFSGIIQEIVEAFQNAKNWKDNLEFLSCNPLSSFQPSHTVQSSI